MAQADRLPQKCALCTRQHPEAYHNLAGILVCQGCFRELSPTDRLHAIVSMKHRRAIEEVTELLKGIIRDNRGF